VDFHPEDTRVVETVLHTSFIHHTSVGRTNKNTVNSEASDENDTADRQVIRVHSECAYQLLSVGQKTIGPLFGASSTSAICIRCGTQRKFQRYMRRT
jgi:hypothetical protein